MTLTDIENDIFIELATISAGKATKALSLMIGQQVNVTIPSVHLQIIENIPEFLGNVEEVTTVIVLKISGKINGTILLCFEPKCAISLANILTHRQQTPLDHIALSALKEVGNIISGASLAALSDYLGLNLIETVPDIINDMIGAIGASVAAELGDGQEDILVLSINFLLQETAVSGKLYFFFDSDSAKKIIEISKEKLQTHG